MLVPGKDKKRGALLPFLSFASLETIQLPVLQLPLFLHFFLQIQLFQL